MNAFQVKIRRLRDNEIVALKDFPPGEWHFDLPAFLKLHFGQPYFYPIVAELDQRLVGCGNALLNGAVGWLGSIIVLPEYRRQGIGQAITRDVMDYLTAQGCASQLLIATKMGEPVYRKLGFVTTSQYVFYRSARPFQFLPDAHIRKVEAVDAPALEALDRAASAEARAGFVGRFFSTGWVFVGEGAGEIEGFFLPDLGSGLVIARSVEAGLALLKLKLSLSASLVVLPEANLVARDLLIGQDFEPYMTVPRMVWGEEVDWKPEWIFNRGAGYCG
jgi:GNAT superfamily N-acetyltransferase